MSGGGCGGAEKAEAIKEAMLEARPEAGSRPGSSELRHGAGGEDAVGGKVSRAGRRVLRRLGHGDVAGSGQRGRLALGAVGVVWCGVGAVWQG